MSMTLCEVKGFLDAWPETGKNARENYQELLAIYQNYNDFQLEEIGYSKYLLKEFMKVELESSEYVESEIGSFDGYVCEVERKPSMMYPERVEIFYGGEGGSIIDAVNHTHGHVVSNDGINIHYWRKPKREGGNVIINNENSEEKIINYIV